MTTFIIRNTGVAASGSDPVGTIPAPIILTSTVRLVAAAFIIKLAEATLAPTVSLVASTTQTKVVYATLAPVFGSSLPAAVLRASASALLAPEGTLRATANLRAIASATLAPAFAVEATSWLRLPASARLSPVVGMSTPAADLVKFADAKLSVTASMAALIGSSYCLLMAASAKLQPVASLNTPSTILYAAAYATLAPSVTIGAASRLFAQASALIAPLFELRATAILRLPASARLEPTFGLRVSTARAYFIDAKLTPEFGLRLVPIGRLQLIASKLNPAFALRAAAFKGKFATAPALRVGSPRFTNPVISMLRNSTGASIRVGSPRFSSELDPRAWFQRTATKIYEGEPIQEAIFTNNNDEIRIEQEGGALMGNSRSERERVQNIWPVAPLVVENEKLSFDANAPIISTGTPVSLSDIYNLMLQIQADEAARAAKDQEQDDMINTMWMMLTSPP